MANLKLLITIMGRNQNVIPVLSTCILGRRAINQFTGRPIDMLK
jgi:hypothetical protein